MENGNARTNNTPQNAVSNTSSGKGNVYTTIRIYPGNDGQSYTLEIVEPDAMEGKRIDQYMARKIVAIDNQFRDPQFVSMIQQTRQNPMGFMQGMFQRLMGGMGGMGGMMPPMGGNPFGGGFM